MPESKRGSNGGTARKKKLSPERMSEIATLAAQKRWGKKKSEDVVIKYEYVSPPIVPQIIETIEKHKRRHENKDESVEPLTDKVANPEPFGDSESDKEPKHCPACAMGQSLDKGEGAHILGTLEHPIEPNPIPNVPPPQIATPAPQTTRKKPTKPMPKAFKGASSYAEKRLSEAIKERAEYMGMVAALNAEIPSLVSVIRALGTSVIPQEALQAYPMQVPNYAAPQQPVYPVNEQINQNQNPIDPALFSANSNPLPGLSPAAAQAPIISNTSAGGAIYLDFVPVDEEGPGLPKMGSGWV